MTGSHDSDMIFEQLTNAIFAREGFRLLRSYWQKEDRSIIVAGFSGHGGYLIDRDALEFDDVHIINVENDGDLDVTPLDLREIKNHVPCYGRVSSDPEDTFCDFYFFA